MAIKTANNTEFSTPAFVVDERLLSKNLSILSNVKARTNCRVLLAQKAFSMFSVYPLLRQALDGCCASSVHEARLAREEFGGEVHAFAAAFSEAEMVELATLIDGITFNSFNQWKKFRQLIAPKTISKIECGLRVNPEHSEGQVPLYDPCAPCSRLGILRSAFKDESLDGLSGLHFHNLCEQNADSLERTLKTFETGFGDLIPRFKWVNFGGGHHITREDYDVDLLCQLVSDFQQRYGVLVYLEPGEAVALNTGVLVAEVLDVICNEMPIAILDTSCTCHMPDVLEMPYRPRVRRDHVNEVCVEAPTDTEYGGEPGAKAYTIRLAGPSCLAGDIIGDYSFNTPLKTGDRLVFEDMAHYTMVKTTTFNGIRLPSIYLRQSDGKLRLIKHFGYEDFKNRLS